MAVGDCATPIGFAQTSDRYPERVMKNKESSKGPATVPLKGPLPESEELLRCLVESIRDYAIILLDTEGRVISWSAAAERLKGYRPDEIIGQHFSRFYPKEDIQRGKAEMELKVAAAEGRFEDEGWRLRKDGTQFWASVVITALRDKKGELRGFGKV